MAAPTESEIYISSFLASAPSLSEQKLGELSALMTDRYTNAEWAQQIAETQRRVLRGIEEKQMKNSWKKYPVPEAGSKEFAKTVDHTVLKLDVKEAGIDALCSEARTEGFKSVCVRLPWVQRCISNLKGSDVLVACVVGFHEGTQDTYSKLAEARAAVAAGAHELDVVLNHSILTRHNPLSNSHSSSPTRPKPIPRDSTADTITAANTAANARPATGSVTTTGPYASEQEASIPDYSTIYRELASIRSLCPSPTVLKLILETSQLSHAQILAASHLAAAANFDFIKTSTGFNGHGATLEHVRLMVAAAEYLSVKSSDNGGSPVRGKRMEVKASGGVRGLESAREMLEAGATRLGSSSGVWIMQEGREKMAGEDRPGATRLYTDDSVGGY